MKFLILFLLTLSPLSLFALEEEDFRIYKKPLLPGVAIAQTDTHTELLYEGNIIKKYLNTEFAIELLPHGPNDDPDCYNTLVSDSPALLAKNILGKEYLRSCLVLQTKMIGNRYILFYGPSLDGNRVSVYDLRTRKFVHAAVNNAGSVKSSIRGGLIFLTKNTGNTCQRSIFLYKDGVSRKIFDECALRYSGIPLIKIDSYRVFPKKVVISYTPYITTSAGDIILDKTKRSQKILPL